MSNKSFNILIQICAFILIIGGITMFVMAAGYYNKIDTDLSTQYIGNCYDKYGSIIIGEECIVNDYSNNTNNLAGFLLHCTGGVFIICLAIIIGGNRLPERD